MTRRHVIVEADGGSRGNPGPAAYGAVLKDAETGAVIAEDGTPIGIATNNVAEYSGLIAGLRLAAVYAPGAEVEVRMDSKLVVEQMSGHWRVKHPDLRPLMEEATRLAPAGTTYTWVPRALNADADRLANEAMDGVRHGVTVVGARPDPGADDSLLEEIEDPKPPLAAAARGWSPPAETTTLVLVRHGVTPHTREKRFSGGLGGANPGLSDEGRSQIRQTAEWILPLAEQSAAVVSSPVRRTLESAEILADTLGTAVDVEPGFAEVEFGHWDGLTFAEVMERFPEELERWRGSLDTAPEGGESFRAVEKRVLDALARLRERFAGRTVVVVSHVTPIKILIAHAVGAPLEAVYRMELAPASVTMVSYFSDDLSSMRLYNALPPGRDHFGSGTIPW